MHRLPAALLQVRIQFESSCALTFLVKRRLSETLTVKEQVAGLQSRISLTPGGPFTAAADVSDETLHHASSARSHRCSRLPRALAAAPLQPSRAGSQSGAGTVKFTFEWQLTVGLGSPAAA